MSPLLKAALAWILALALPMQGLAAATMLHCASSPAPQTVVQGHVDVNTHAHAGHHGVAAADADAAQHGAAHSAQASGDTADNGGHQCSACAACVAGAALPSAVSVVLPVETAGAMLLAAAPREFSVVLAGLERPPRSRLA
jgi:hypothetical protein